MWEYIFDYQQRQIIQDKLNMNDLCLLFYFSKQIIDEEFLIKQNPSEYKDFIYTDLTKALPILDIETKQIKNIIKKLFNAGYINIHKLFAGISVSLTFKALTCLSKRQSEENGNRKYFLLLKWKKISTLNSESGKKFPSFNTYYIYNTKNILYNNSNNIYINTEEDIINNSNNINSKTLLPLFKKYSKFETNTLKDLNFSTDFNVDLLIKAIDNSTFLQEKVGIKFLINNYNKIIRGDYEGVKLVYDKKDIAIQKAFISRNYNNEELNNCFDDLDSINL